MEVAWIIRVFFEDGHNEFRSCYTEEAKAKIIAKFSAMKSASRIEVWACGGNYGTVYSKIDKIEVR